MLFAAPSAARQSPVGFPPQRLRGLISWNAWTPDVVPPRFGQPASFFTDFTHDKRVAWGGAQGWDLYSAAVPGSVNTQAIVDASFLTPCVGIVDFLIHVFYPPRAIITNPGDQLAENDIPLVYDAHVASTVAGRPSFCLMAQAPWLAQGAATTNDPWPYFAGMVAYFRQEMLRPGYTRIRLPGVGLVPLLGVFDAAQVVAAGANAVAQFLAFRAQLPACCLLSFGSISTSSWASLGCQGGTSYGVLGGSPGGAGQHSWATQDAFDLAQSGQPGFMRVRSVNWFRDPRPRQGAGAAYSDQPTVPEGQASLAAAESLLYEVVMVGEAGNELDEANGGVYPGVQDAPLNASSRGPALDAWGWQAGLSRPATYLYKLTCLSLKVTYAGAGWATTTAVAGAYFSQTRRSAVPGDLATITLDASVVGTTVAPVARIYGPKGPLLGTFDVLLNGVLQFSVSQFAGVLAQGQQLASLAVTPGDVLGFRVNVGQCELDAFGCVIVP